MNDMLVDPKSHELAEHFLGDDDRTSNAEHEARVQSLALAIQQAVEDWMEDESDRLENHRQKGDDDGAEYGHPGDRLRGVE